MIRIGLLPYQMVGEMKILDKRAVYDGAGALVHLTDLLKTGDDAEIFLIDGTPGYCAKIFHENQCTAPLFQKIVAMVAHPPDAGQITGREEPGSVLLAWPCSVLFDSPLGSRNFIGYAMPLVDTELFREARCYYDPQSCIRHPDATFSWRYLLTAAYHIAAVTDDLHRHGHCIANFSDKTILIASTAAVAVIHCDSFQIRDSMSGRIFPSSAGAEEFMPPELQGYHFTKGRVDRYDSDLFGLAVMVFRLFMDGIHPFQAEGEGVSVYSEMGEKIQNGLFAFASPDHHIHPPSFAPDYRLVPPAIRRLFYRCFVDGVAEPARRPSAGEWKDCLHSEIMAMKHCRVHRHHWFGGHLLACPWCSPGAQHIFPAEGSLFTPDEPVVADTISPAEERVPSSPSLPSSSAGFSSSLPEGIWGMTESVVAESDVPASEVTESTMPESDVPASEVIGSMMPESDVPASEVIGSTMPESDAPASEVTESTMPESFVHESEDDDSEMPVSSVSESDEEMPDILDIPEMPDMLDSTPGILLPKPHVTMHNLARGITIPICLPVTVTGKGPLLIHVTSDVRWIEIANTAVSVEGEGGVYVTLNTGNMSSKGFQKGRVMLQADEIQEEIFLFVSVTPDI